ncbi:MAG: AmmeMemoRadiSam system protein B [Candidatus Kapabacteria bacterium]|nr:AmmeMemoRadiSam system protein B [Candidatus Kapabacteria bacterium]
MDINKIIPALRSNIFADEKVIDGKEYFILSDPNKYADQPLALPADYIPLLQFFNGKFTINVVLNLFRHEYQINFDIEILKSLINTLDQMCFLDSSYFGFIKQEVDYYRISPVRKPVCTVQSYPAAKEEFADYVRSIIESSSKDGIQGNATGIIIPHIDYNLGTQVHEIYSAAYRAIQDSEPELVVILGTSHRSENDFFIPTTKHFETPAGIVMTDSDLVNKMYKEFGDIITKDDILHRTEHSIEYATIVLQQLFKDRKFQILPILIGSFYEFVNKSCSPKSDFRISGFIEKLSNLLKNCGKKMIIIASVDLAHIGRKFGDNFDAEEQLDNLEKEDANLIELIINNKPEEFFNEIIKCSDNRRICGLSPIYIFLTLLANARGEFLKYGQWSELETKSAVSFASLAFYD